MAIAKKSYSPKPGTCTGEKPPGLENQTLLATKSVLEDKARLENVVNLLNDAVWKRIAKNGGEFYFYHSEKVPKNFCKTKSYSISGRFLNGNENQLDSFTFDVGDQNALSEGKEIAFCVEKNHKQGKVVKTIAKQPEYGSKSPASGKDICGLPEEYAAELLGRIEKDPEVYDALEFVSKMNKRGMKVPIPDKLLPRETVFIARKEGDTICIYSHAEGGWLERGMDVRSNVSRIGNLANLRVLEEHASHGSILVDMLWHGQQEFNSLVRTALALHVIYVQPPVKWDAEKLGQARQEVLNIANELYQGKKWLFDKILSIILRNRGCPEVAIGRIDIDIVAAGLKAPSWKDFEPGIRNKEVEAVILENLEKNGVEAEKLDGGDRDLISRMAVARIYLKETLRVLDKGA